MIFFRKISFEKSAKSFSGIYHLKDGFGLLKEYGDTISSISLIFLDLYCGSVQKLYTVECPSCLTTIVVNKTDSTTFLLTYRIDDEQSSRIYKIDDNAISVKDVIEIGFFPKWFYDKFVYGVTWPYEYVGFLEVRIL
jgi:hypothetical protein